MNQTQDAIFAQILEDDSKQGNNLNFLHRNDSSSRRHKAIGMKEWGSEGITPRNCVEPPPLNLRKSPFLLHTFFYKEPLYKEPTSGMPNFLKNLYY